MTNLSLTDPDYAQAFALPEVLLDPGERLGLVSGEMSAEEIDQYYGLNCGPTDTTIHFVFQDGFALDADGGSFALTLAVEDGSEKVLEEVDYGEGGAEATLGAALQRSWYMTTTADFDEEAFVEGDLFAGAGLEKVGIGKGLGAASSGEQVRGQKLYELRDHLGNVTVVLSDRALPIDDAGVTGLKALYFAGQVKSARDFYPYGMVMVGRKFDTPAYRYGFNGMEGDDELKGESQHLDFGARGYDPKVGRWAKVDLFYSATPGSSPYNFSMNTPIQAMDPDGNLVLFVGGLRAIPRE